MKEREVTSSTIFGSVGVSDLKITTFLDLHTLYKPQLEETFYPLWRGPNESVIPAGL
ncbi:hypothetical protein Hanom_Chr14g01272761 [Helianthus anomalus]